jgi:hypothetical protein
MGRCVRLAPAVGVFFVEAFEDLERGLDVTAPGSNPSRTARAAMTSAATESAHIQPNKALSTRPIKTVPDRSMHNNRLIDGSGGGLAWRVLD